MNESTFSSRGLKRPRLFSSEAVDDLLFGELKLIQKRKGYRYSVDALLLADFALPGIKKTDRVIDLGAGSGVIGLILAKRSRVQEIVGVEIQKSLAGMARRNVALNGLEHRVKIIEADARELKKSFKRGVFDLVVSNPPFRKVGTGFLSPNRERSVARYELKLSMPEALETCGRLVKPRGRVVLIYPFERLRELAALLDNSPLCPTRLRLVFHSQSERVPILFCIELKKGRHPLILEPNYYVETEQGRFFVGRDNPPKA